MDKIINHSPSVSQVISVPPNDNSSRRTEPEIFEKKNGISDEELKKAIDRINHTLHIEDTSLKIEIDHDTSRSVAQIINNRTGEIIRQIPSKDFLEWEKEFTRVTGILFDKKA